MIGGEVIQPTQISTWRIKVTKQVIEFDWDFPEPLENYGEGRYYWTGDDWKRASEIRVIPSYDQETFNNGMYLLLYRAMPIVLLLLIIWMVSYL
jgi:hypothetical protein